MIGYNEIAEVSRYLDAQSEEGRDFEDLMRARGIDPEGLVRGAEQRAMRAAMVASGVDPTVLSRDMPTRWQEILGDLPAPDKIAALMPMLQLAYIDGFIAGRTVSDPADRIQRFPERKDS